jgi:anthranilate synthase component 2/para-aminobenzoate synthetase
VTAPEVVVVDHYDSYTWNLVHLVAEVTGVLPTVLEHDRVSAEEVLGFTHVVLSPGPGHPGDPHDFGVGREVVRRVAAGVEVPVLGVCLGLQGIVTALGGTVDRVAPAHGEVALVAHDGTGVLRGLPSPFRAVRYHSLAALRLPDDLVSTATSDDGTLMAARHRSRPLEGVQFHPESVLTEHGRHLVENFLGAGDG